MDLPRSDRAIVAICLVILGVLFSFDQYMGYAFRGKSKASKKIAEVEYLENTVKIKLPESFTFNRTHRGEALPHYTSVYAGLDSKVDLKLSDNSKITVGSESLIILEPRTSGTSGSLAMIRVAKGNVRVTGDVRAIVEGKIVELNNGDASISGDGKIRVLRGTLKSGKETLKSNEGIDFRTGKKFQSLVLRSPANKATVQNASVNVAVDGIQGPIRVKVAKTEDMKDPQIYQYQTQEGVVSNLTPGTYYIQVAQGDKESFPHEVRVLPKDPPKIVSPILAGKITIKNKQLQVEQLPFVEKYVFEIDGKTFESTTPSLSMEEIKPGEHQVSVFAKLREAQMTAKSSLQSVLIFPDEPPLDLSPPMITELTDGADIQYFGKAPETLEVPFEEVVGATQYEVQIAKDEEFKDSLSVVTQKSPAVVPKFQGQRFIRIVAIKKSENIPDQILAKSPYSRRLAVNMSPLVAPTLVNPQALAKVQPGKDFVIQWLDPSNVGRYRVEVARDQAFQNIINDKVVENSRSLSLKMKPGSFFVRVRSLKKPYRGIASDSKGYVSGGFSEPYPLYVKTLLEPFEIRTQEPVHRALLKFDGKNSQVHFAWDTKQKAKEYQLEIVPLGDVSLDSLQVYQTKIENVFTPKDVMSFITPDSDFTLTTLKTGTFAYRVTANVEIDGEVASIRSVIRLFRVECSGREIFEGPELNYPNLGQLITMRQRNVTFSWSAVKNVDHYLLVVSRDPDFTQKFITLKTQELSYNLPNDLSGRFYWRVWAIKGVTEKLDDKYYASLSKNRAPASVPGVVEQAPSSTGFFSVDKPKVGIDVGVDVDYNMFSNSLPAALTQSVSDYAYIKSTKSFGIPTVSLGFNGPLGKDWDWETHLKAGMLPVTAIHQVTKKPYAFNLYNFGIDGGAFRRYGSLHEYWEWGAGIWTRYRGVSAANPFGLPSRTYLGTFISGGGVLATGNRQRLLARLRLLPINYLRISAPAPKESVGLAYGVGGSLGYEWMGFWGTNWDLGLDLNVSTMTGTLPVGETSIESGIKLKRNFF